MCGAGCSCWSWVCGDCCYHDFCAVHDDLLRACLDSPNPATCFWSLPGVVALFLAYGGCDGWF
jgi:hypothetical protein